MRMPKVFYGYWIVVVLFFCLFIMGGCGIYSFSLFVRPLQNEFGWGRGEIMLAYTFFFLILGVTAPLIGRLVIRYGARKVMAVGASLAFLGFILLTLMQNLVYFYACYIIIAVGFSASGMIPATTVVSNWFNKRRGTAIGIVTAGLPAGGIIFARLIGGFSVPNLGWETSFLILALITLAIVPMVLLIVKTKPAEIGLYPDGASEPESVAGVNTTPISEGINLKMAFTTSTFWLMVASFIIFGFVNDGVFQHQVPHLQDIGFPVATAVAALSVWGVGSLSGHLFFGWLCDRIQAKYALCLAFSLRIVAIIILMNVVPTSPTYILLIYAVLMGASMGAGTTTSSILIINCFGLGSYSILFGFIRLVNSIGSATGPLFMGYMYDNNTTYDLAFTVLLILGIAAIPIALAIRRPSLLSDFTS